MSLYDDFDSFKQKSDHVAGWSSGIKLFQSQMQLKKAAQTQVVFHVVLELSVISSIHPSVVLQKREPVRKTTLAPVFDLKNKKENDASNSPLLVQSVQTTPKVEPDLEYVYSSSLYSAILYTNSIFV